MSDETRLPDPTPEAMAAAKEILNLVGTVPYMHVDERAARIIDAAISEACEPLRIELENNRKWMRAAIDEMCTATFDLKGRNCRGLNDAISVGRKLLTPKEPT